MKDTVINIVAGLGLISFITMFCDFIMLNYVSERKIVRNCEHGKRVDISTRLVKFLMEVEV